MNKIKIFLMKSESLLTLHRQQCNCVVVLSWTRIEDWHEREELLKFKFKFKIYLSHTRLYREYITSSEMWVRSAPNKVIIFLFFAHKKYSRSFIKLRLNHFTWTVLMSLLRFWALNVVVVLLPMQGQKALGFIKNILTYVPKVLRVWNDMKVSN